MAVNDPVPLVGGSPIKGCCRLLGEAEHVESHPVYKQTSTTPWFFRPQRKGLVLYGNPTG